MPTLSFEFSRNAYRADFGLYALAVAGLAAWLACDAPAVQRLALLAATLGGALTWTAMEYVAHRFILHRLPPFLDWHAEHHRRPKALLGAPTLLSAFVLLLIVAVPAFLVLGAWLAVAFTLGVLAGYFAYTIVHHATHHWRPRTTWLRRRLRDHAIHHHAPTGANFGVTTAFWDHVCGTFLRAPSNRSLTPDSEPCSVPHGAFHRACPPSNITSIVAAVRDD